MKKEKIYFPEKVRKNRVMKLVLTIILGVITFVIGSLSFIMFIRANDDFSEINIVLFAGGLLLLVPSCLWWFNFYYKTL